MPLTSRINVEERNLAIIIDISYISAGPIRIAISTQLVNSIP
jgi:hypothetical protein